MNTYRKLQETSPMPEGERYVEFGIVSFLGAGFFFSMPSLWNDVPLILVPFFGAFIVALGCMGIIWVEYLPIRLTDKAPSAHKKYVERCCVASTLAATALWWLQLRPIAISFAVMALCDYRAINQKEKDLEEHPG